MLRQTDEERCQQCKNESLDEGDEDFQHTDNHCAENGQRNQEGFGDEDQSQQGQDYGVSCDHVGKKTNTQCEGLGEQADDLHRDHDGYHESGDAFGNHSGEIFNGTVSDHTFDLDEEKGAYRQRGGNGNIAGGGGTPGD